VPGTGQLIRFRDWLADNPVEVIVIPCQWRAADIVREIEGHGIRYETILIDHLGELVDFFSADHPYLPVCENAVADLSRLADGVMAAAGPLDAARHAKIECCAAERAKPLHSPDV